MCSIGLVVSIIIKCQPTCSLCTRCSQIRTNWSEKKKKLWKINFSFRFVSILQKRYLNHKAHFSLKKTVSVSINRSNRDRNVSQDLWVSPSRFSVRPTSMIFARRLTSMLWGCLLTSTFTDCILSLRGAKLLPKPPGGLSLHQFYRTWAVWTEAPPYGTWSLTISSILGFSVLEDC